MRQAVQHLLAERDELVVVQHSEMLLTAINVISSFSFPRAISIMRNRSRDLNVCALTISPDLSVPASKPRLCRSIRYPRVTCGGSNVS
jgi:hypothetical protein